MLGNLHFPSHFLYPMTNHDQSAPPPKKKEIPRVPFPGSAVALAAGLGEKADLGWPGGEHLLPRNISADGWFGTIILGIMISILGITKHIGKMFGTMIPTTRPCLGIVVRISWLAAVKIGMFFFRVLTINGMIGDYQMITITDWWFGTCPIFSKK